MYDANGLPIIIPASAYGMNQSYGTDQAQPQITGTDSLWSSVKSAASSAVDSVEVGIGTVINDAESGAGTIKNTGISVYQGSVAAIKTVVGDATDVVAAPIEKFGMYAIIGVVVIGGALYFLGKSGAFKVNAVI